VQQKKPFVKFMLTGLFCLVVGAATEVMQRFLGRSFQYSDILNDIIGGYAGLFIAQIQLLSNTAKSRKVEHKFSKQLTYIFLVLMLSLYSGRSFIKAAINEYNLRTDFPIMSDFETPFERDRWRANRVKTEIGDTYAKSGSKGMKVTFLPATYPSINLRDFITDWTDFQSLRISIFNPKNHTIKIVLKIDDHIHHHRGYRFEDRFNMTFNIDQGWNDLSIPLNDIRNAPNNRMMAMNEIFSVSLFMIRVKQPKTIYIDDVYLSR
jgi:hypothetical protein